MQAAALKHGHAHLLAQELLGGVLFTSAQNWKVKELKDQIFIITL